VLLEAIALDPAWRAEPPGTGKTRLIRAILGEMSRRKGEQAECLYTGDMKALESDGIFVKFITGTHDAFVVEDADHLLKPRADGNQHLHRFLTIADGVVRSQGRKIIFSTNLPNIGDLDEALIRPGRCFARARAKPHHRGSARSGARNRRARISRRGGPPAFARRGLPRAALSAEFGARARILFSRTQKRILALTPNSNLLDLEALVGDDALHRRAFEHAVLEGAVVLELRHRQLAPHAPHVKHEGIGVEHRVLVR
jgi:ATPase family associated with various cellular activities (AAA)